MNAIPKTAFVLTKQKQDRLHSLASAMRRQGRFLQGELSPSFTRNWADCLINRKRSQNGCCKSLKPPELARHCCKQKHFHRHHLSLQNHTDGSFDFCKNLAAMKQGKMVLACQSIKPDPAFRRDRRDSIPSRIFPNSLNLSVSKHRQTGHGRK